MLIHKGVLGLVESLNGDDSGSNGLSVSYLHDAGVWYANAQKLLINIQPASNFVEKPFEQAAFHTSIFHPSEKLLLGNPEAALCRSQYRG